jgi:hypothetical protein
MTKIESEKIFVFVGSDIGDQLNDRPITQLCYCRGNNLFVDGRAGFGGLADGWIDGSKTWLKGLLSTFHKWITSKLAEQGRM